MHLKVNKTIVDDRSSKKSQALGIISTRNLRNLQTNESNITEKLPGGDYQSTLGAHSVMRGDDLNIRNILNDTILPRTIRVKIEDKVLTNESSQIEIKPQITDEESFEYEINNKKSQSHTGKVSQVKSIRKSHFQNMMDAYSRSYTSESQNIMMPKNDFQPLNPKVLKLDDLVITSGSKIREKEVEIPVKSVTNSKLLKIQNSTKKTKEKNRLLDSLNMEIYSNRKEFFFNQVPVIQEEDTDEVIIANKVSDGGLAGLALQATIGALQVNSLKAKHFQEYVNSVEDAKTKSVTVPKNNAIASEFRYGPLASQITIDRQKIHQDNNKNAELFRAQKREFSSFLNHETVVKSSQTADTQSIKRIQSRSSTKKTDSMAQSFIYTGRASMMNEKHPALISQQGDTTESGRISQLVDYERTKKIFQMSQSKITQNATKFRNSKMSIKKSVDLPQIVNNIPLYENQIQKDKIMKQVRNLKIQQYNKTQSDRESVFQKTQGKYSKYCDEQFLRTSMVTIQRFQDTQGSIQQLTSPMNVSQNQFESFNAKSTMMINTSSKMFTKGNSSIESIDPKLERVNSMAQKYHEIKQKITHHYLSQHRRKPTKVATNNDTINTAESNILEASPGILKSSPGILKSKNRHPAQSHDTQSIFESKYQEDHSPIVIKQSNQLSQIMKQEIYETVKLMDYKKQKRDNDKIISKRNQIEFINNTKPDSYIIDKQAKTQIRKAEKGIEQKQREMVKIDGTYDKNVFKREFQRQDIVLDVMLKDKEFAKKMANATPEVRNILNEIFKNAEKDVDFNAQLGDFFKDDFSKQILKLNKKQSTDILPKVHSSCQDNPKKNRLKKFLMHHIGNQESNILGKDVAEKIQRNKHLELGNVLRIGLMQSGLEASFKDQNIGQIYDSYGENLWQNDYLNLIQIKFKNSGLKVQVTLQPNEVRHQARDQINVYFNERAQKQKFYTQAKDGKLTQDHNSEQEIMLKYYEDVRDTKEIPNPTFAQSNMNNGVMLLQGITLSEGQATALGNFLTQSDGVRGLIIDDTKVTDESFAKILKGLSPKIEQICYQNNDFGEKSVQNLKEILPFIYDLRLSKLKLGLTKQLKQELLISLTDYGRMLLKLKLSKINLTDVLDPLCDKISNSEILGYLDLSWTSLTPRQLLKVSEAIQNCVNVDMWRSVNLSYNTLMFTQDQKQLELDFSHSFLNSFLELLARCNYLNHVDLSGMGWSLEPMVKLAHGLVSCPNLASVHLSNNGFYNNLEAKLTVLDIFGIDESQCEGNNKFHTKNKSVSHSQWLKKTIAKNLQKAPKMIGDHDYHSKLLKSKQSRSIAHQKSVNAVLTGFSAPALDNFIVCRKPNYPELIFNQKKQIDKYFIKDSCQNWAFSEKCYVCERHTYVAIFYEQSTCAENEGLIEIKNQDVIQEINDNLNLNLKDNFMVAPFIIGSVVSGGFDRKLRMLRSDLFTLLSVIQSRSFMKEQKQSEIIKKGIIQFTEKSQDIKQEKILDYMEGWNKILAQKLSNNQLTDIQTVNKPDLQNVCSDHITYTYAAFLPAGNHTFIIYCPVTKRAFCKDITVHMNTVDIFPEFPIGIEHAKVKIPTQNVWRKWIEDSEEDLNLIYMNDLTSGKYEPELFISKKQEDQIEEIHKIIKEDFKKFMIFFKELQIRSQFYPLICFETFYQAIQESTKKDKLQKAQIEICFMKATKTQKQKGLKNKMCRAEFFDMILRCVAQIFPKQIIIGLSQFSEDFIEPFIENSTYTLNRFLIRDSKMLNRLFLENGESLTKIFKDHEVPRVGFTLEMAIKLINSNESQGPILDNHIIKKCFIFSQMSVKNEQKNSRKYEYLLYVEFLEFLGRVALNWNTKKEVKVVIKVYNLLKIIYESLENAPELEQIGNDSDDD